PPLPASRRGSSPPHHTTTISCFLCSTSCLTHRASRVVAGGVVPEPLGGAGVRPEAGQGRGGRLDGGPHAAQCRLPGLGGAHREGEDQADRACSPHFELCSCSVRRLMAQSTMRGGVVPCEQLAEAYGSVVNTQKGCAAIARMNEIHAAMLEEVINK